MSSLRPELHVTAESGILEAAAGMLRNGDTWHMLYQYRPAPDQPSRWGHQLSQDGPFDWAIYPDVLAAKGGETKVLAGSVVSNNGGADLFFTSVTAAGTSIQFARVEDINNLAEITDDPLALDPSVHRSGVVISDTKEFARFRSPCVVPDWQSVDDRNQGHDGWLMLTSTGEPDSPVPVILESGDGKDWDLLGPLTFSGDTGLDDDAILVAPRLIRLRDEVDQEIYDVLLLTIERQDGLDRSGYIVGKLKQANFEVSSPFQRIDHGHDFTRPRNTNYTRDTVDNEERYSKGYLFGLFNGVGRGDDATKQTSWKNEGWANSLSLPRSTTLQGGKLFQTPAAGLPDAVEQSENAKFWSALCEIPHGSNVVAEIADKSGEVIATVTHSGDMISVDRHIDAPARARLDEVDEDNISIVVDGNTLEVYAGGGSVVMSSRIIPKEGVSEIRVTANEDATIETEWRRGR
ncbi:GH32 C-terminal domain-containing protein [Corynebacterium lubricantis]|uniref:GH32 C-terminal domain-containing protein n=1 Tax=Corynebacterium lubricantis TaxID=541095 RepID=UPI00035E59B5|nr:GH32 C-terminal domain-containing protein [Corynebacterium lubricantis]